MVYNVIGLMSGSSLDGLDIAFVELTEISGKWGFELKEYECIPYPENWKRELVGASTLQVEDFLNLHTAYGRYLGKQVSDFIEKHSLQHKIHFISSHGHTAFHDPKNGTSFQLGDGASIAAHTGLTVISDLRNKDVALGGQGAPIVPIADKLLLEEYDYCLNLGGIANVTINNGNPIAFDICPANQVLNYFAQRSGKEYDDKGMIAQTGIPDEGILKALSSLEYYQLPAPKSLANTYSNRIITQLESLTDKDALATAVHHIANEIQKALASYTAPGKMLVSGGGAFNDFLVEKIRRALPHMEVFVPAEPLILFKEAIAMALIGALRWREEENVLHSVTGASASSVGGAIWVN